MGLMREDGTRKRLAAVFLWDTLFLVVYSFLNGAFWLIVFTGLIEHYEGPPTDFYCRGMCGDGPDLPMSCRLQFCNVGSYIYTEVFEILPGFLCVPYIYLQTFKDTDRRHNVRIILITLTITVFSLSTDILQLFVLDYLVHWYSTMSYGLLFVLVFNSSGLPLRDVILLVIANATPALVGIICVEVLLVSLSELASGSALLVSYAVPFGMFLVARMIKRCIEVYSARHDGRNASFDATLFKMNFVLGSVQLLASTMMGKDALRNLSISTIGTCFWSVVALAWNTPRIREMFSTRAFARYIQRCTSSKVGPDAVVLQQQKSSLFRSPTQEKAAGPLKKMHNVAHDDTSLKDGVRSLRLWKDMAITMVTGTLSAIGMLVAVLLFRNIYITKILPNHECYNPDLTLAASIVSRVDFCWYIPVVTLELLLFSFLLEWMEFGVLATWKERRVSFISIAVMMQLWYSPYMVASFLAAMLDSPLLQC